MKTLTPETMIELKKIVVSYPDGHCEVNIVGSALSTNFESDLKSRFQSLLDCGEVKAVSAVHFAYIDVNDVVPFVLHPDVPVSDDVTEINESVEDLME